MPADTTTTPPRLLSVAETVDYLDGHFPAPRIYDLIAEGLLPAVRIGRRVLVHREKLDALIDAGGAGLSGGWRHAPEADDDDDAPPPEPTPRSRARDRRPAEKRTPAPRQSVA